MQLVEPSTTPRPLGSDGLRWITHTELPNGRVVRPGDTVNLLPPERIPGGDTHYKFMERWLRDKGPFTISQIGEWPCLRVYLYIKAGRSEPGVDPGDFE